MRKNRHFLRLALFTLFSLGAVAAGCGGKAVVIGGSNDAGGASCATICASAPAACSNDCTTQCGILQDQCAAAGQTAAFDAFAACGPVFTCNGSSSQVINCQQQAVGLLPCLQTTIDAGRPPPASCATICTSAPAQCAADCNSQCAMLQIDCEKAGQTAAFDAFLACGPTVTCNGSSSQVTNCMQQAAGLLVCLNTTLDAGPPIDATFFDVSPIPDATMIDAGPACDPTMQACCDPNAPFVPIPWAPPAPFSTACSGAQLGAYAGPMGCLTTNGDCSAFRADAMNAACVACLETDVSAMVHGPVVTTGAGANLGIVEVNWGGCEAHLDGDTSATGCGAKFNNLSDCINNDCSGCSDFSNGGPVTNMCESGAFGTGTCENYKTTQACLNELFGDGGVAVGCGQSLSQLVADWCGGG